ncbi:MAG: hypothetical protein AAGG02_20850 [Cyanobacteria bacterium P01_H01_bin.15]
MQRYFLVLIETSSNQEYIFATNKLKENIGASELTYQAGTQWVLQAIAEETGQSPLGVWSGVARLRNQLRNPTLNPPIEASSTIVEILTAASGKALLLTKKEASAKSIISFVTRQALINAPGLDVCGVYVPIEDWEGDGSLAEAVKSAHELFESVRTLRPSPQQRFLRLPIISNCSTSGFPASKLETLSNAQLSEGGQAKPISLISEIKRQSSSNAKQRLIELDKRLAPQIDGIINNEFEPEPSSWLGIVHADGNGLGQIFLRFGDYPSNQSSRNYVQTYRDFSLSLDECTEAAFKKALEKIFSEQRNTIPLVPLILGGDDLTVICDGHYALEFSREFLLAFEQQTTQNPTIASIAQHFFGVERLSACAGIAIVKRHFPFSIAYNLAEQLIKSAKSVKELVQCDDSVDMPEKTPVPCSAIDFHILYDSVRVELADIRERLQPEPETKLFNRPYVVTEATLLQNARLSGQIWADRHRWKLLSDRVSWLTDKQAEDALPSSQYHALRKSLYLGQAAADSQYNLICQRYGLDQYAESSEETGSESPSLFFEDIEGKATTFLDALDAKDFLHRDDMEPVNP